MSTSSAHPWAEAWEALSPLRRAALHARVVDREPLIALAGRLGRSEADTEALVGSTVRAFRREVVLGLGTGYDEECGSLVLRLTDSAGERLTRSERRALGGHAAACAACAPAVGQLLELDVRLRDGLITLLGAGGYPTALLPVVPPPRQDGWPAAVPGAASPGGRDRRRRRGMVIGLALSGATVAALAVGGVVLREDVGRSVTAAVRTSVDSQISDSNIGAVAPGLLGGDRSAGERDGEGRATEVAETSAPQRPAAPERDGRPASGPPGSADEQPVPGQPGPGQPGPGQPGPGQPEQPEQPGGQPGPDEDPDVPPLDVAVDESSGSVTLTVGVLGTPIVFSTPPITG